MIATLLLPLVLATQSQILPVHAMQAREHVSTVSVLERKTFFLRDGDRAQPATERFARTIYGYYPYWADHDETIPWEHLTHLAFFSVALNPDGSLGDDPQLGLTRSGSGRGWAKPRGQSGTHRNHV